MIYVVLFSLLVSSLPALISNGLSSKSSNSLYIILVICLVCVAGFRSGSSLPDYATYAGYYSNVVAGQLSYFIEISFVLLAKLSNIILADNSIVLFVIYAIIGVSLKTYAIKKLTPLFFLSLLIYISNYFILHEMIQIRAGVATAFILLSIVPLYDRSLKNFVLLIGLAALFHYSSIIFLLLWFLKTKRFNRMLFVSLLPLSYLLHFIINIGDFIGLISSYIPFVDIVEKLTTYSQGPDAFKINLFGLFPLTRIIILLFFMVFVHNIQRQNKYFYLLLKMYAIGIFSYIALSSYPVIAVRIGYTLLATEIVIIPTLVYIIKGYYYPRLLVIFYAFLAFSLNVFFTSYFKYYGEERNLMADDSIYNEVGAIHSLANNMSEPLNLIELQSGTYKGKDDIERLDDLYVRV